MKKKQQNGTLAATACQLRGGYSHPFGALRGYVPLGTGEEQVYRQLREAIPVLDAAVGKLVRLSGGFSVACSSRESQAALEEYLKVRRPIVGRDENALFLSGQNFRISRSGVHALVKKHLGAAGIDPAQYSSHKLRHTAATLMLQNGVDVRAVQEVLGHEHLNTTEIYTHIDNDDLRVAARANPLSRVKKQEK